MTDLPPKTILFRDKEQQQKHAEEKEMVRSPSVLTSSLTGMGSGHSINPLLVLQGLLLDEQTGCLLKFSGELEDVSREDFHELFSGHGKIKWVDFTRGAKEVSKHPTTPLKSCTRGGQDMRCKKNDVFLLSTRAPSFSMATQRKRSIRPRRQAEEN